MSYFWISNRISVSALMVLATSITVSACASSGTTREAQPRHEEVSLQVQSEPLTSQQDVYYQALITVAEDEKAKGNRDLSEDASNELRAFIRVGARRLAADQATTQQLSAAQASLRTFVRALVRPGGAPWNPATPPPVSGADVRFTQEDFCPFYPFC